jgi:hypothetical protein
MRALLAELEAPVRHGAAVGNLVSGVLPREAILRRSPADLALARPAMATTNRELVARSRAAPAAGSVVGRGVAACAWTRSVPATGAGTRGASWPTRSTASAAWRRTCARRRSARRRDCSTTASRRAASTRAALAQVIHDVAPQRSASHRLQRAARYAEGIRRLARGASLPT